MQILVVDGVQYKSVREACKKYGVSYSKVLGRIKHGMSLEEAIKNSDRADFGSRQVEVNGKKFNSVKDVCSYYNVNYYTVINKRRYGMSIEDALNETGYLREKRDLVVDGVRYNTIKEVCEKFNLKYSTIVTRLYHGMTIEEAVKCRKDCRAKEVFVEGRKFNSIAEACRYFGVDYGYVRYQVRKGLSLEEAIKVVSDKYGLFKVW